MTNLMRLLLSFVVLSLAAFPVAGEQYRSKVLLDPNKQLNESAELTLDELEKQMDQMDDSYLKSSAGRHLARHYLQNKQYQKAAKFYQDALAAEGLSAIANQQMLKELASVYLLMDDYPRTISTITSLQELSADTDPALMLILAQAQYKTGDHLAVADTLDVLIKIEPQLTDKQLRQMLSLYYNGGNFSRCEHVLHKLIDRDPKNIDSWRQLTSIYLKQNKRKQALNQLSLAYQKRLTLSEQDLMLLVDLYAANQSAFKAARLLTLAISQQKIDANAANYQRLFEYWLQARDKGEAIKALQQAARLSGKTVLYLHLAQLQMEQQAWRGMNNSVKSACKDVLQEKYVSRANLYLGISELKLGNQKAARQALINATLIGGSSNKANEWLTFMQAAPAQASELRSISGICRPENRRVRFSGVLPEATKPRASIAKAEPPSLQEGMLDKSLMEIKTISGLRIYAKSYQMTLSEMAKNTSILGLKLGISVIKNGGSIDGPALIIFENFLSASGNGRVKTFTESVAFSLAMPVTGRPVNKGGYKLRKTADFKCAEMIYHGEQEGLKQAWQSLAEATMAADFALTGEARQVLIVDGNKDGMVSFRLQLGVQ